MAADDLHTPLGVKAGRQRSGSRAATLVASALVAIAATIVLTAVTWIVVVDDPDGGEPVAIAKVEDQSLDNTGSLAAADDLPDPAGGLPQAGSLDLVALPQPPGAADIAPTYSELVEPSRFGPLPRIGGGGLRPMDAYGRRDGDPALQSLPKVVIVVGGMGISPQGTARAIEALPETVTLAFAPYGANLQQRVDEARADGHEVLLQVPMEPFNFPATDPGEHTLLASAEPTGLQDNLHWSLSRMTGYTGVMNYLGGRFTSDPGALSRFLALIGGRGLLYLDDGTSPSSRASEIGMRMGAPVLAADIVLDADRDPQAIEMALAELERLAQSRGLAIGSASAFDTSIDVIADWADSARSRGIGVVSPSSILR